MQRKDTERLMTQRVVQTRDENGTPTGSDSAFQKDSILVFCEKSCENVLGHVILTSS